MSRREYTKLIEGFCGLVGIKEVQSIVRDAAVTVDGVVSSLIYDEEADPEIISIYVDFGPLPSKRELEACMGLMEANLFLSARRLPLFGVSPHTRNVTLAAHYKLDSMTPEKLHLFLRDFSYKAKEWRKNHFLDLKPKAPGSARGNIQTALMQGYRKDVSATG